jgi:transcriptional regulator with XRE-family HTH domain
MHSNGNVHAQPAAGSLIRARLAEMERGPTWLARKLGKSPSAVHRWVGGSSSPQLRDLPRIATALGVSVAYLVGASDK